MQFLFISPKKNAFLYTVKIITGSVIVWFGLRAAGIPEPYWAVISLITVTEPDVTQAKLNFKVRTINTFTGSVTACLVLLVVGPGFSALLLALALSVLVATLLQNYPANWRLAPTTVVVLMAAASNGSGFHQELDYALLRVAEVLTGSTVALLQSLLYAVLIERIAAGFGRKVV